MMRVLREADEVVAGQPALEPGELTGAGTARLLGALNDLPPRGFLDCELEGGDICDTCYRWLSEQA